MSDYHTNPTLISCPACNSKVSNQAASCPRCGQPIAASSVQPQPSHEASRQPSYRPQARPLALEHKIGFGCLGVIVLLIIIGSLLGRKNTDNVSRENTNAAAPKQTTTPQPSPSATPPNTDSPDYKAGLAKGVQEGQRWVKDFPKGITPQPALISAVGQNQAEKLKPKNPEVWLSGWEAGFVKGYKEAKWKGRNEDDYEPLSWENAKLDVRLYDDSGTLRMTVVGIDRAAGTITVAYPKESGGVIEKKSLDAMTAILFVRKDDPALNRP